MRKMLGLLMGLLLTVGVLVAPATVGVQVFLAVSPSSGPLGSVFGYAAVGFEPGVTYTLQIIDASRAVTAGAPVTADGNGEVSGTINATGGRVIASTIVTVTE